MTQALAELDIDEVSLLVRVTASLALQAVEDGLRARGFTLSARFDGARTVGDWLATGAPGARSAFSDPVDHLVAGLELTLPNGKALSIRPGPRRAVGPDLTALALGTGDQLASIQAAWLRVHPIDVPQPSLELPEAYDLDPPLGPDEIKILEAVTRELRYISAI
jgi:alkyldihydroxyacetonephosphate synthase